MLDWVLEDHDVGSIQKSVPLLKITFGKKEYKDRFMLWIAKAFLIC
jgi:hypothetical protein